MDTVIFGTLFLLGAIVASFIGVVVARLNTGQGFIMGYSRCDACDTPLSLLSLIPILSFAASKGRAQCCGASISYLAPLSEVLLGSLFVLAYAATGLSVLFPLMLAALSLLLALVLYDLAHQILPASLLYAFVAMSMLIAYVGRSSVDDFFRTAAIAIGIAGSLAAIHFFSRGRAMGFADAPLAFGLAFLSGSTALTGFLFSFWIGAVVGIVLLALRPAGSRMGVEVPFAPFLAFGFLLAYFTQWSLTTFLF